jgi:hypothetical protein
VPDPTLQVFKEKDTGAKMATMNNRAVIEAFERAGLQFIPENGDGAGIRMRAREGSRGHE